ncbi:nicotinamide-nucleotide adenylyltransferase [Phytohabitans flavus]|uniref:Transcriptional regulator NadR n=1 Tax=Phytohabitans flavus TaxID=1076124 RepID=A0A6F8XQE0_9ACTN|nr:AAA family ATPase [Phytohabitans flavus]BCB75978.1 transcriptional regulator NadR [Phytohabitans flavus]
MTSTGVVVGKFLPPHLGHSYLIDTALAGADRVVVVVCARPDDPFPAERRAAVLRELHPAATVVVTPDDIPDGQGDATSEAWAHRTVALLGGTPPDVVFTSEGYGERYAAFLGARHVCVDRERRRFPVSGTAVRADPWRYANLLSPAVRAWFVTRVCVLGAESTGTTTLARDLADHYRCEWVPEYGRAYSERRPAVGWRREEFVHIARCQQSDEDAAARRSGPLLICDTDALATSVWHERYVGTVSPEVERLAAARTYALYILTADDIPFVQDGTRDGEHVRGWMTHRFRRLLEARPEPWIEVRGDRPARLAAATARIDALRKGTS